MSIENAAGALHKTVVRNLPKICIGLGVASLTTSIFLTIKATPKALAIKDSVLMEMDEATNDSIVIEKVHKGAIFVKRYAPIYAPSFLLAGLSVGLFLGAQKIQIRRTEMLVTAYSLGEKAFSKYQDKVIDRLGEKTHLETMDALAEDTVKDVIFDPAEAIITTFGDTRCYDAFSGRYFLSDINNIRRAENEIVKRLGDVGCCTVNDFYEELGLPSIKAGGIVGWDANDIYIDVNYSSILDPTDTPCLVIDYRVGVLESRYHIL